MNLSVRSLRAWSVTSGGRKVVRYTLVSVMNVVLGEAVLGLSYLFLHWSATAAAVVAVVVATLPAYFLNRMWVWGRTGRSHLVKEVIPFWALALIYLVLSVGAAQLAARVARGATSSRPLQAGIIMGAILIASGVLWLLRFAILDTLVFVGPGGRPGRAIEAEGR